ncbi:MAG TPA: hypothetical protein VLG47_03325 [Candidatus Saccharimonadales bacterium]|nr:hypothetical protein [Candidatus Saccharimonadales bacterium]
MIRNHSERHAAAKSKSRTTSITARDNARKIFFYVAAFLLVAGIGSYLTFVSRAATSVTSAEAENGTSSGNTTTISDGTASNGSAVKFGGNSSSGLSCKNPVYSATWPQTDFAGWDGSGGSVQNDVQSDGTGPATDMEQLNVCSLTNWNVVANWQDRGGSINAYPDTNFDFASDKTVSTYTSMQTCYGNIDPIPSGPQWPTAGGSEWDYAYDVWINNHTGEDVWANDIEIMVWNDFTDTSFYPPAGSRAITIDGVAYHMFRGGGANEWIYTRDTKATSGCFDMLNIIKDITNHQTATTIFTDTNQQVPLSQSGLTNSGAPQHLEYGVEISGTHGTQTFQITNATLTVK